MRLKPLLMQSLQTSPDQGLGIEPGLTEKLIMELNQCAQQQEASGKAAVLLVQPSLRASLARMLRSLAPNLHVLAYNEVPDSKQIRIIAAVGGNDPVTNI